MNITVGDRGILRGLAASCRGIAETEKNRKLKERWRNLNDLKHSGPPLLIVSPEGSWREIRAQLPAECEGEFARELEWSLRQRLYHHDVIQDDAAFDPTLVIACPVEISFLGLPFKESRSAQATGAYHIDAVITDLDSDLERLQKRKVSLRRPLIEERLALAHDILGDLLEVRPQPDYWWTCGLSQDAIRLLGLENFMLAMYDNPDGLHRLMRFLSEEMMEFMTFFEREQMLDYNNGGNHVGSGNLGYTSGLPSRGDPVEGPVQLKHLWGFAESQETVGVSPEMFGEFIFPYQRPLLEKFGLSYYGCCEASETRWKDLKTISRLRCISVAPWSDQATCAALFGRDYVYCRKPNPSPVCVGFHEAEIRREFEETLRHAGALNTVMVLKDTHTVENEISRFARWVNIGRRALDHGGQG